MFRLTIESSSGPQDVNLDIQTFTALGILQFSKRLYVWIYILRAWGWLDSELKHVAHIVIVYLRTLQKYCCVWLL